MDYNDEEWTLNHHTEEKDRADQSRNPSDSSRNPNPQSSDNNGSPDSLNWNTSTEGKRIQNSDSANQNILQSDDMNCGSDNSTFSHTQASSLGQESREQYWQNQQSCSQPPQPPRSNADQPVKAKKRRRFWPRAIAVALVCIILGGGAGIGGSALYSSLNNTSTASTGSTTIYTAPPTTVNSTTQGISGESEFMSNEEIYASYVNACVAISTEIITTNLFGQTSTAAAAGSGFVLTSDGYVITNYHVIEDATSIDVTFYDGSQYAAVLVGGDSGSDVAVLKIDAENLTTVVIGDSDSLAVGQDVCTIGNPLGEMTFSQTNGIVSAVNRSVTMSDGTVMNMIQTNCTINAGNSGGPLFNQSGQVVGITSAKYTSSSSSTGTIEGIGFAIPMNDIIDLVTDIIENGYATGRPSVGVLMNSVSTDVQRYGIPAGAEILAVLGGSCADKAGLQVGDIVTAIDGTEISTSSELSEIVESHHAGDSISFAVYRDGETLTLSLTLDEYTPTREEEMNTLQNEYSESQNSSVTTNNSGGSENSNGYNWFGNNRNSSNFNTLN